jgi:hypothetical protein
MLIRNPHFAHGHGKRPHHVKGFRPIAAGAFFVNSETIVDAGGGVPL